METAAVADVPVDVEIEDMRDDFVLQIDVRTKPTARIIMEYVHFETGLPEVESRQSRHDFPILGREEIGGQSFPGRAQ